MNRIGLLGLFMQDRAARLVYEQNWFARFVYVQDRAASFVLEKLHFGPNH